MITVIALFRFGLITLITARFVDEVLHSVPITTNSSDGYSVSTIVVVLVVLALAGFAFHTSLGGAKSL